MKYKYEASPILDFNLTLGRSVLDDNLTLKVEIEELKEALANIGENAFSPQEDDTIWMDDTTTLGAYIDSIINRLHVEV